MRSVVGLLVMAVMLAGLRVDLSVRSAAAMENGTGETVLTGSLNRQVTQGTDDAEEAIASGITTLTSSELEFVNDPDGKIDQVVGMRFLNIDIPNGATIVNSYLIFTVDETSAIPTSLTIYGEAADNAATYAATLGNITARAPTTALVQWAALPEWAELNTTQQTPSLNTLLQEIVRRPGWQAKNALAFMIRGSGRRPCRNRDAPSGTSRGGLAGAAFCRSALRSSHRCVPTFRGGASAPARTYRPAGLAAEKAHRCRDPARWSRSAVLRPRVSPDA